MPLPDHEAPYTRVAIALHWLIALLVVAQFAWGWWMLGIAKQPVGPRVDAFNLHKSMGLVIFALMALRILWRLAHRPPALPPMPRWQAMAAHVNHYALYALLLIQPLSGYLGSEVSGYPVKFFGMTLPAWAGKNLALKDFLSVVHLISSWLIAATIVLHVAAAVKHALVDRDGLLSRMGIPSSDARRRPDASAGADS